MFLPCTAMYAAFFAFQPARFMCAALFIWELYRKVNKPRLNAGGGVTLRAPIIAV